MKDSVNQQERPTNGLSVSLLMQISRRYSENVRSSAKHSSQLSKKLEQVENSPRSRSSKSKSQNQSQPVKKHLRRKRKKPETLLTSCQQVPGTSSTSRHSWLTTRTRPVA